MFTQSRKDLEVSVPGQPSFTDGLGTSLTDKLVAEFLGTFIYVLAGLGATAHIKLSSSDTSDSSDSSLTYDAVSFLFSFFLGSLLTDRISGAHLNPSVTLSVYLAHKLDWVGNRYTDDFPTRYLVFYSLSQTFGALMASVCLYMLHCNKLSLSSQKTLYTSSVFVTWHDSGVQNWQSGVAEFVSSLLLMLTIWATLEPINGIASKTAAKCAAIGCCIFALIFAFSGVCGPALNPARDIGPRLLLWVLDWNYPIFSGQDYYFWIPLLVPLCGGVCGTVLYHLTLRRAIFRSLKCKNEAELLFGTMSRTQPTVNMSHISYNNNNDLIGANNPNNYYLNKRIFSKSRNQKSVQKKNGMKAKNGTNGTNASKRKSKSRSKSKGKGSGKGKETTHETNTMLTSMNEITGDHTDAEINIVNASNYDKASSNGNNSNDSADFGLDNNINNINNNNNNNMMNMMNSLGSDDDTFNNAKSGLSAISALTGVTGITGITGVSAREFANQRYSRQEHKSKTRQSKEKSSKQSSDMGRPLVG